jgi:hypothetical protein
VDSVETPIAALPLQTVAELHTLQHEWTATAQPHPVESTLHELVEARVRLCDVADMTLTRPSRRGWPRRRMRSQCRMTSSP